jgi:transposase
MMRPSNALTVYVCVPPVDGRLQITGPAALVQDTLELNPFAEQLYVFADRRRNRPRCLYWDRNGFVLWTKRAERDRSHRPRAGTSTVRLSAQELNWLLDGFDLRHWRARAPLRYAQVS